MIDLGRFVSPFVRRWVASRSTVEPEMVTSIEGAVLSADIAGFTAMTERLASQGQAGIERIQRILNQSFAIVVGIIEEHGGEIIKFAGDATLAWWPAPPGPIDEAVMGAVASALRLQEMIPRLEETAGVPLRLRVTVSAGQLWTAVVGGEQDRWEAVIGGAPFEHLSPAVKAKAGTVVVSASAFATVEARCVARERTDGSFIVERISSMPGRAIEPSPDVPGNLLEPFVPRHLVERLRSGQGEWLAEVRPVSVLFATSEPFPDEGVPDLQALQTTVQLMQQSVYEHGGSIVQLLIDDRGAFVLVAAWGVPLSSFTNDAERAVRAAYEFQERLGASGRSLGVGVATGKVFSGLRGATTRAEYALIGNAVNRAARLMQLRASAVSCDEQTAAAATAIAFEPTGELELKGIGAVRVMHPVARGDGPTSATREELIGRQAERETLRGMLDRVVNDPTDNRVILVEGEAGLGKSHLTAAFVSDAKEAGLRVAAGACDPLDARTAYRPLRALLAELLELPDSTERASERVYALLGADEQRRTVLPLLGPVLDLEIPDNETTRAMGGTARSEATIELVVELINATYTGSARVLVIEDVHWMDSASWIALEQMLARCRGLCVVLITRPVDADSLAPGARSIFQRQETARMVLEPLSESDVEVLIAQQLRVADVPARLSDLVSERAGGHPLFVREVLAALQDHGVITIEGDRVAFDATSLTGFEIPNTLQGVIVSRLDRLTATQQLTLKVASVVGRTFDLAIVKDIFPQDVIVPDLSHEVGEIVQGGLLDRGTDATDYAFGHATVRDAIYELLPLDRRRELHAATATWYEGRFGADTSYLGRIASHWTSAHDAERAPMALERAGDHALDTGAYGEALGQFRRLVDIMRDGFAPESGSRVSATDVERGRWLRKLGLSEYNLGDMARGRTSMEDAAAILGDPVPSNGFPVAWGLAREFGRQVLRSKMKLTPPKKMNGERVEQAAKVLQKLGGIYHVGSEPALTLYTIIRGLNLNQTRGVNAELMGNLAGMSYVATLLGRHKLAKAYIEQLKATQAEVQSPLEYADALYAVTVVRLGMGEWRECDEEVGEVVDIFTRLGERRGRMGAIAVQANLAELTGKFETSRARYTELHEMVGDVGDDQSEAWAWGGLGMIDLRQGRYAQAIEDAVKGGEYAHAAEEKVSFISSRGTLAAAYLRLGELQKVQEVVESAIPLLEQQPRYATAHHNLNGYDALSETILALWEASDAGDREARKTYARWARLSCGLLRRYARTFPIGRPAAAMWTGLEQFLLGRNERAFKSWREAIAEGERVAVPFDLGRAHSELARHAPVGSRERRDHAAAAAAVFERIGAQGELERIRNLT